MENALMRRIRRMVRNLANESKEVIYPLPGLEYAFDSKQSVLKRSFWGILLMISFACAVYQGVERVFHYYSNPVAVQIQIIPTKISDFPALTICTQETPDVYNLMNKQCQYFSCEMMATVLEVENLTARHAENWKRINATTVVQSATIQVSGKIYPLQPVDIYTSTAICPQYSAETVGFEAAIKNGSLKLNIKNNETCQTDFWLYVNELPTRYIYGSGKVFSLNTQNTIQLKISKYNYVNRPEQPCLDKDTFQKCESDCYERITRNISSRFWPFITRKFDTTTTQILHKSSIIQVFGKECKLLLRRWFNFNLTKECGCIRKCQNTEIELIKNSVISTETSFLVSFAEMEHIVISEYLIYEAIQMLCDIGGNSGLFLGLSVLSFFELITLLATSRNARGVTNFSSDPIFRIVKRTWILYWEENKLRTKIQQSESKFTLLDVLFFLVCCSWVVFVIANRVVHFISQPLLVVIDTTFMPTNEVPGFIFCWESNPDPYLLKSISELHRNFSKEKNLTVCDVHILDLLDVSTTNATYLWKMMDYPKRKGDRHQVMEGYCAFMNGVVFLNGASTRHFTLSKTLTCDSSVKVYLLPKEDVEDLGNYAEIPVWGQHHINFHFKELRFDSLSQPCVSKEKFMKCRSECLSKELKSNLKCRLPSMPYAIQELPFCHNSTTAKAAQKSYLEIVITTDVKLKCSCVKKCRDVVLQVSFTSFGTDEFAGVKNMSGSSIIGSSPHIRMDIFHHMPAYSFVKFVCDIGSLTGIVQGFCLLSVVDMVHNFFLRIRSSRKTKH